MNLPDLVRRLIPPWLAVQPRPLYGRVVAVRNSPGSPYAPVNPMTFDIVVDWGPPTGERLYENQRPANDFPQGYDTFGMVRCSCLIAWNGDQPWFTIPIGPAVTDLCDEEPPP